MHQVKKRVEKIFWFVTHSLLSKGLTVDSEPNKIHYSKKCRSFRESFYELKKGMLQELFMVRTNPFPQTVSPLQKRDDLFL